MIELDVFLEGTEGPIGRLSRGDDEGTEFRYLRDDLPTPVSIALPVREQPYGDAASRAFFSNLLFENRMREQIMARHGIGVRDYVGLLAHLGADCPGAISCIPRGAGPGKTPGELTGDYEALSQEQVVEMVHTLARHRRLPKSLKDPSPLAGVQSKVAVTRLPDGRLALPRPGSRAPTTHILKVPTEADQVQVQQEHVAMSLMRRLTDHPVAETEMMDCDGLSGLLVARFDRVIDGTRIHRIHQEDFCQALGLPEQLKYERYGEPGRRFDAHGVGRVLDQLARPGAARLAFFEVTLAGLALGNTDAHGKNHAILHGAAGPELAPVYDVLPTILHDVRHDMAFRIGAALMADDITSDDIKTFLLAIGVKRATAPVLSRGKAVMERMLGILEESDGGLPKRMFDAAAQQVRWLAPPVGINRDTPDFDLVPLARVDSWE